MRGNKVFNILALVVLTVSCLIQFAQSDIDYNWNDEIKDDDGSDLEIEKYGDNTDGDEVLLPNNDHGGSDGDSKVSLLIVHQFNHHFQ